MKDYFSPLILPIITILVLIMGYIGSFDYHFKEPLQINLILTIIFAIIFFILGILLIKNKIEFNGDIKQNFLSKKLLIGITSIALLLQLINLITLGGIPLFDGTLKSNATTMIWRISYVLFLPAINILITKYYNRKYLIFVLIGILLFGLNGYRTSAIGILASIFITMFYIGKINKKIASVFIILIVLIAIAIGFIASQSIANQHWVLNPIELIFYRLAFTLKVLEKCIPLAGTTHGHILAMIFSSGSPRTFIGQYVLHYHVCLTSTLFGPVLLDFGYIGLAIQMFIMGALLKIFHFFTKNKKVIGIYSIILTHSLIWIETGPTDIMIWLFYVIGIVIVLLNYKSFKLK